MSKSQSAPEDKIVSVVFTTHVKIPGVGLELGINVERKPEIEVHTHEIGIIVATKTGRILVPWPSVLVVTFEAPAS